MNNCRKPSKSRAGSDAALCLIAFLWDLTYLLSDLVYTWVDPAGPQLRDLAWLVSRAADAPPPSLAGHLATLPLQSPSVARLRSSDPFVFLLLDSASGYLGGRGFRDYRLIDVMSAFPGLLFAILIFSL